MIRRERRTVWRRDIGDVCVMGLLAGPQADARRAAQRGGDEVVAEDGAFLLEMFYC